MLFSADVTRTKVLMGTFVSITLPEENKTLLKGAFELAKDVDNALSHYKKNSPVSLLNTHRRATLYPYTKEALALSLLFFQQTKGYFNIATGEAVREILHSGRVSTKSSANIEALHVKGMQATLDANITIDLGGMGKGFGVDRVKGFLKQHGLKRATIAFSGDIYCIGECRVAVHNPLGDKPLAVCSIADAAFSTSGNYENYFQSPEKNHLINPKTQKPQQNVISLTLLSKELSNAALDAYATAASVMPPKEAKTFLKSLPLAYIMLKTDFTLHVSDDIGQYCQDLSFDNTDKKQP